MEMPELFFYLIVLMVVISAVFKTFKIMFIGSLAGMVTMLFKWGEFSYYAKANPGIGLRSVHSDPFPMEIIFVLLIVIFIASFIGLTKQKNDNDNTGKTEKPQ